MVDVLTPEQRKLNMSRIRGKNTKPEMVVRRLVHSMGYRFRLHRHDLPGSPDLVFVSRKKVILVHGCYWHMHACRFGRVAPATNAEFWRTKRESTVSRDKRTGRELQALGWRNFVVWECELSNDQQLAARVRKFLGPPK